MKEVLEEMARSLTEPGPACRLGPRTLRVGRLLVMGLMLPGATGCDDQTAALGRERPNVVVYCIDTLRADHLGCYGYARETSPFIDELAGSSVLFENGIAQAPWTVPSVASLVTSTYPSTHGVVAGGRRLPARVQTMAELFEASGYRTAGFIHNPHAGSVIGANQGYTDYLEAIRSDGADAAERQRSRSIGAVIDWIRERHGDRPFFLYVHTTEPHWPYHARTPFGSISPEANDTLLDWLGQFRRLTRRERDEDEAGRTARIQRLRAVQARLAAHRQQIIDLYDNAIIRADQHLARVVQSLRAAGVWKNTVFVLLADHGQEMDEHGYWQHDQSLFQELIRVPMLVRLPGDRQAGRRIVEPAQLIDILPTLADLAGIAPSAVWEGRSLRAVLEGRDLADRPALSERINLGKDDPAIRLDRGDFETALVRTDLKAIWHRAVDRLSLFDLRVDPIERTSLDGARPEQSAKALRLLQEWVDRDRPALRFEENNLSREQIEGLRELGYLK